MKKLLFTLGVASLFASCARNPVTGKKQLSFMSEKQEIATGQESDPAVIANFGLYQDQKLQDMLTTKGLEMAKISHRPNLPYKFQVLNSPVVNAFAVPGGYVYFTRGILAHFNNEAELTGVLGHEIGHITARHSAQQYTEQILAQVGMIATIIVKPELAQFAEQAQQGIGMLFMKFSRDNESQSDKLGVDYSTKIGYDSHNMADFFKTLGRVSDAAGARIPAFMSTHPDPDDRFNVVHKLSNDVQVNLDKSKLKTNRNEYLQLIDGLVYGEDPREGYVEGNIFYHPELKFFFAIPQDWKTQNSPTQFVMAEPTQKAMMVLTTGTGANNEEVAANIAKQLNLDVKRSDQTTVNGLPALVMYSEVNAKQQQQQNVSRTQNNQAPALETTLVQTYIIEYNKLFYVIHGVAVAKEFETYRNSFTQTMSSFSILKDQSKINVQPEHIRIKTASKNATLSELLTNWNMPTKKQEEIAILNGLFLTSQVAKGTLIKTVGK